MLTTLILMAFSSFTILCLTEINPKYGYTPSPEDEYDFLNDQLH